MSGRWAGFTLLELMIALAIVGILLTLGQPAWRAQHRAGVQAQAMATLQSLAGLQERLRTTLGSYQSGSVLAAQRELPATVAEHYRLVVEVGSAGAAFVLRLVPRESARTGPALSLDHTGRRQPADLWR